MFIQMAMVEVVVAMEVVATVAEVMEEEEAMGAATEGGVEEGEDTVEEGAAVTEDGVEEDMAEEETGGTGETVGEALPGDTTTSTELWEDHFGTLCNHQCHVTIATYFPSPVDNITNYMYVCTIIITLVLSICTHTISLYALFLV